MAMKRLPNDVQSLLCASSQVKTYKRAIEELVHNSLDAEATSIAIRIHIQESTVQVIDNGYGVTKLDFNALGQRFMTSKITDISTLKVAPKTYGYRGEFLANIIAVSQIVKITSRHVSTEETWAKTFHNAKEKKLTQMSTRPTKGTTVDIKGFLYNQNIQKRGIDPINELQNIKLFLEQLSLVHNNISLSLRDDSKNEIIFKIHKKRDIYQTVSTLFDIDKADILELQVEKNDYKVKGLIGKKDKDHDLHWIYLNGKFIHSSSKLHKIINEYFKKSLLIKDQRKLKSKKKNYDNELMNQNIPFYFIFVTCPYIDYDNYFTSKQSVIEFKNWEQMNKLLEKLVKFYDGDVNLKEIKKSGYKLINKEQASIKNNQDIRDQVKKIMDKILGSPSKKLGVSQLQNGVKGKLVKRKRKKVTGIKSTNISTLFLQNDNKNILNDNVLPKSKIQPSLEDNLEKESQPLGNNLNRSKEHKDPIISKKLDKKGPYHKEIKKMKMQKKERKPKNLSPTRKTYKTSIKQRNMFNKHKKLKFNKKDFKERVYLKETDSVYRKSRIVAQKAEEFLKYQTRNKKADLTRNENVSRKVKKKIFLPKQCDNNNYDHMALPPKMNKYFIEKYVMNKLKTKSYKTTYDLVQTILTSQQVINTEKNNIVEDYYRVLTDRQNVSQCTLTIPKRSTWRNKSVFKEFAEERQEMSRFTTSIPLKRKTFEHKDNFSKYSGIYGQEKFSEFIPRIPEESEFACKNIYNQKQNINFRQNEALSGPFRVLTYDSHQYHRNEVFKSNNDNNRFTINKRQNVQFITKQSRDNFVASCDFKPKKRPSKSIFHKQTKIYDIHMRQTLNESLYTIEYSKSNENNYNTAHSDILANSMDYFKDMECVNYDNKISINELNSVFGNTYTIQPSNFITNMNIPSQNHTKTQNIEHNEQFDTYSINYSNSDVNNTILSTTMTKDGDIRAEKNLNIVFVSESQCSETEGPLNNYIEPLNVCETILNNSITVEEEFAFSFNENYRLNDSLFDKFNTHNSDERIERESLQIITHKEDDHMTENIPHHFSNAIKTKQPNINDYINDNVQNPTPIRRNENDIMNEIGTEDLLRPNIEGNVIINNMDCNFKITNFNYKSRPRFLPKGMSQIFENCRSKTACDYNLDTDYYEDSIYDNFANEVQVNAEIYEPIIQNVDDLTTKNIHKFKNKVKKDNASLVFDEKSLKEAKVLGQADCKFIAAIMKKRCREMEEGTEYLILFDQHAVHERILLEKNLADYTNGDSWTSVPLDNIILKMSKDEVLYLHNYKDKFTQLGLQWSILNDSEVIVNSIPEAILGKNPREVEKVIKAVRNLIVEEINVIKLQKGCVSLYPKSIMDLVFSEACRYALKFGDQLSKKDCVELLNELSDCKTPFQCAHGRPVMAVLMDIKCAKHEYKIDMAKLSRFKPRNTANR